MNLGIGQVGVESWVPGILIGLFLAALLLRSACDLCQVEPSPGYWRCFALAVVLAPIGFGVSFGAEWAAGRVLTQLGYATADPTVLVVLLSLLVMAIVSVVIFVPVLRVRASKAALIWLLDTLLSGMVLAIMTLLMIGGWTIVGSIRRLV